VPCAAVEGLSTAQAAPHPLHGVVPVRRAQCAPPPVSSGKRRAPAHATPGCMLASMVEALWGIDWWAARVGVGGRGAVHAPARACMGAAVPPLLHPPVQGAQPPMGGPGGHAGRACAQTGPCGVPLRVAPSLAPCSSRPSLAPPPTTTIRPREGSTKALIHRGLLPGSQLVPAPLAMPICPCWLIADGREGGTQAHAGRVG